MGQGWSGGEGEKSRDTDRPVASHQRTEPIGQRWQSDRQKGGEGEGGGGSRQPFRLGDNDKVRMQVPKEVSCRPESHGLEPSSASASSMRSARTTS